MTNVTKKYEKIIKHYGVDYQMSIWVEELSELQKVICKWSRNYEKLDGYLTRDLRNNFVEEMADVVNVLNQIMITTNINFSEISEKALYKIYRTLDRIKNKN